MSESSPSSETITLTPGLLVTVSTRVEPGPLYKKRDLTTEEDEAEIVDADAPSEEGEGAFADRDVSRWETTRVILHSAEYKEANKVRSSCRQLVVSACLPSRLGFLICPVENVELLDQRFAEAQTKAAFFNSSADTYRVRINSVRGIIASSKGEAEAAVGQELGTLIRDLEAAVAGGRIETIRDLSNKATQVGKLIDQQSRARGVLDRAVAASRKIARQLKRAAKMGEDAATVLEEMRTAPIAAARFLFTEGRVPEGLEVEEEQSATPALPGVAVGRFAGLLEEEDAADGKAPSPETSAAQSLAKEIHDDLERALAEFGTYTFDDKGAHEVMEVEAIAQRLLALPLDQMVEALEILSALSERGSALAQSLAEQEIAENIADDAWEVVAASTILFPRTAGPMPAAPAPVTFNLQSLGAVLASAHDAPASDGDDE